MRNVILTFFVLLLGGFILNLSMLSAWENAIPGDWRYFNSNSIFVASAFRVFQTLPLLDPWMCGGVPFLATPESRVFSPFVLLDIFFRPQLANIFSIVFTTMLGLWGAFRLFRFFSLRLVTSVCMAFVAMGGSWYGLHYTEGHIPFEGMMLFPLIIYCGLSIHRPSSFAILVSVMAFMLLDGGVNSFIIGCYALILLFLFKKIPLQSIKNVFSNKKYSLSILLMGLCLALSKVIPTLATFSSRAPQLERTVSPISNIIHYFFNPFQHQGGISLPQPTQFLLHEYGCYLGIGAFIVFLTGVFNKDFLRKNASFYLIVVVLFWIGSGWGGSFNPWTLHQKLPLFQQAHVQPRFWILMYAFFVLIVARRIDSIACKPFLYWSILAVMVFEAGFTRNYPAFKIFKNRGSEYLVSGKLIESHTVERTIRNVQVRRVAHYYDSNSGSYLCYEPTLHGVIARNTLSSDDENYSGEISFSSGQGQASILRFDPSLLSLQYRSEVDSTLKLNTNLWSGWRIVQGAGEIVPNVQPMHIRVPKGESELVLKYRPKYLYLVLSLFSVGVLLFVVILFKVIIPSRDTSG